MIENISQNSSQQLALFPIKNKEVSLSFTGQRISSDGGLLLLRELDNFIDSYSRESKVIILDCDDTNTNTHGQQELSLFNHYYDEHCYMPLHIYEGLSDKLITTILKPGRRSKQAETGNLLIKLIKYIRKRWANTTIIVRGDSLFTSSDLMDWCHDKYKVNFITGLAGNAKLKEKAYVTIKTAEREFEQYGKPVKRYHSFIYKAASWKYSQRVIVKVEISHMGTNIR